MSSIYNLTSIREEIPRNDDTLTSDASTVDMVESGLRSMGTDNEYHMANRMQKLRCVALELVQQLECEGYNNLDPLLLQLIDIEVEVKSKKRLTL